MNYLIETRIPFGNACQISVDETKSPVEINFSPSPHGGPETLWFCFRVLRLNKNNTKKNVIRLVLRNFRNLLGGSNPALVSIVSKSGNSSWHRLGAGKSLSEADGHISACWETSIISETTDFALCYPYGKEELLTLISQHPNYWKLACIGSSQQEREILRISNGNGVKGSNVPGIYVIARQHSGETPGSWALHGLLDYFADKKSKDFLIWGIPLSNIDGIENGDYGKDNFPYDLNRAWSSPAMRHETHVIKIDVDAWAAKCKPFVALDFHAPGACENDGAYCFVPKTIDGRRERMSLELAEFISAEIKKTGLASKNFIKSADYKSRWETLSFTKFICDTFSIASLSFEFPYSFAKSKELDTSDYMKMGKAIANGLEKLYAASKK